MLVLTDLDDELAVALALTPDGDEHQDSDGFPSHCRIFTRRSKRPPVTAAAWLRQVSRADAAIRGGVLLRELCLPYVPMCDICSGMHGRAPLGDVIVARRVYRFDNRENAAEAGQASASITTTGRTSSTASGSVHAAGLKNQLDLAAL